MKQKKTKKKQGKDKHKEENKDPLMWAPNHPAEQAFGNLHAVKHDRAAQTASAWSPWGQASQRGNETAWQTA